MRTKLFISIGVLCLSMTPVAFALDTVVVVPERGLSLFEMQERIANTLHPVMGKPMHVSPLADETIPMRTDLTIVYQSDVPLPVVVSSIEGIPQDKLLAILPATSSTEPTRVRIPLISSAAWRPGTTGVSIEVYWIDDHKPLLLDLQTTDAQSMPAIVLAIAGHVFTTEPLLASYSINFLPGYGIAGIPLTALLAFVGLVMFIVLSRRMPKIRAIGWAVCALLLLYQVRFLPNVIAQTVHEQRVWWKDGNVGELGHDKVIAEAVTREVLPNEPVLISMNQATPLRYFLYPIVPTTDPDVLTQSGALAVMAQVWDTTQTTFVINDRPFVGSILKQFENGDALVRFAPRP